MTFARRHGFRVDLHVHSVASPDGSLSAADIKRTLAARRLDVVAVTDHDHIDFALALQAELGPSRIIVGEEISAKEGEVVGLYLKKLIPAGLAAAETIRRIKAQGGLVYIPHPFETVRKGLPRQVLDQLASEVDIVEVYNGRALIQNFGKQARAWAAARDLPGAASSDAHGRIGWGRTCSILEELPTRQTLPTLLQKATLEQGSVGVRGALYPKLNRLRKRTSHVR